jgi:hypothetical protein
VGDIETEDRGKRGGATGNRMRMKQTASSMLGPCCLFPTGLWTAWGKGTSMRPSDTHQHRDTQTPTQRQTRQRDIQPHRDRHYSSSREPHRGSSWQKSHPGHFLARCRRGWNTRLAACPPPTPTATPTPTPTSHSHPHPHAFVTLASPVFTVTPHHGLRPAQGRTLPLPSHTQGREQRRL